ncbi:PaaI family thioesterase [Terricaulis sp.]|uniref:PaaI family thioesterase n=1 Tax=Terricaulis sp. TaxID=2768686 RepID=UPI0037845F38
MAAFDGLAFVKAIQEKRAPGGGPPPWVAHMRVMEENLIESVEPGRLVTNWTPGPQFTVNDGYVQGGLLSAMADGGQFTTLMSMFTEFEMWVTMDLHARFVRPIKGGSTVRIESVVLNKSKTNAVVESTFTVDGKLAAKITGGWRKIEQGRTEQLKSPGS